MNLEEKCTNVQPVLPQRQVSMSTYTLISSTQPILALTLPDFVVHTLSIYLPKRPHLPTAELLKE